MYGMYFKGPGESVQEEYDFDGNGTVDISLYNPTRCARDSQDKVIPPATTAPYQFSLSTEMVLTKGASGNVNPVRLITRSFDENRDYLFPIPTSDLALNRALVQNPGWTEVDAK